MATKDLIGQPFPADLPAFAKNKRLIRIIRQIESFIEIKHDMINVERNLNCALTALEKIYQPAISSMFGCIPITISEGLFSSAIILYSKAFTEAQGRIRLADKIDRIFPNGLKAHEIILELRNNFFAHQRMEANRHQLFFFPNSPEPGKIRLHPEGQTERAILATPENINLLLSCCKTVVNFLQKSIKEQCNHIENSLSPEDINILNGISKTDIFEEHWKESPKNRKSQLSERKT